MSETTRNIGALARERAAARQKKLHAKPPVEIDDPDKYNGFYFDTINELLYNVNYGIYTIVPDIETGVPNIDETIFNKYILILYENDSSPILHHIKNTFFMNIGFMSTTFQEFNQELESERKQDVKKDYIFKIKTYHELIKTRLIQILNEIICCINFNINNFVNQKTENIGYDIDIDIFRKFFNSPNKELIYRSILDQKGSWENYEAVERKLNKLMATYESDEPDDETKDELLKSITHFTSELETFSRNIEQSVAVNKTKFLVTLKPVGDYDLVKIEKFFTILNFTAIPHLDKIGNFEDFIKHFYYKYGNDKYSNKFGIVKNFSFNLFSFNNMLFLNQDAKIVFGFDNILDNAIINNNSGFLKIYNGKVRFMSNDESLNNHTNNNYFHNIIRYNNPEIEFATIIGSTWKTNEEEDQDTDKDEDTNQDTNEDTNQDTNQDKTEYKINKSLMIIFNVKAFGKPISKNIYYRSKGQILLVFTDKGYLFIKYSIPIDNLENELDDVIKKFKGCNNIVNRDILHKIILKKSIYTPENTSTSPDSSTSPHSSISKWKKVMPKFRFVSIIHETQSDNLLNEKLLSLGMKSNNYNIMIEYNREIEEYNADSNDSYISYPNIKTNKTVYSTEKLNDLKEFKTLQELNEFNEFKSIGATKSLTSRVASAASKVASASRAASAVASSAASSAASAAASLRRRIFGRGGRKTQKNKKIKKFKNFKKGKRVSQKIEKQLSRSKSNKRKKRTRRDRRDIQKTESRLQYKN